MMTGINILGDLFLLDQSVQSSIWETHSLKPKNPTIIFIFSERCLTWLSWVGRVQYPGSVLRKRRGECVRKGLGEWEHTERGEGERMEWGDGERTERGECGIEYDWDCEGVRDGAWWLSFRSRGERGGSSGGLRGSMRSISARRGGGGTNSSSDKGMSPSIKASSARDRWSTIPAPIESPTTLMEVRNLSLKTHKNSSKHWHGTAQDSC